MLWEVTTLLIIEFLAVGFIAENPETCQGIKLLSRADGSLLNIYGPVIFPHNQYEPTIALSDPTMPKRARPKSNQKAKKQRQSSIDSLNVRLPIPRNCKNTTNNSKKSQPLDYDYISNSFTPTKTMMGTDQLKQSGKLKEEMVKNQDKDDVLSNSSGDLDVVFDLQEDKKNRVYEVINVMSDDEEPNTVTYERLYADDPEKKVVSADEIPPSVLKPAVVTPEKPAETRNVEKFFDSEDSTDIYSSIDVINEINVNEIVSEVLKESNFPNNKVTENEVGSSLKNGSSSSVKPIVESSTVNINDDSDDDVICVAVLDPKTKNKQKKVEEICLSSDSENECTPVVPPLKLKIPFSSLHCDKRFLNQAREHVYNSGKFPYLPATNWSGHTFTPSFPKRRQTNNYTAADWDSHSNSSNKASSSDEFSPSPKGVYDESSSSALSESDNRLRKFGSTSNSDNSSPGSSSNEEDKRSDEEKSIYWKADRESRRKNTMRYEEFTKFGREVHEGKVTVDEGSTLTFKVMSYNILAQNLLEEHRQLYRDNDRRALGWARRWALILGEIRHEDPQILCLQEVEQSLMESHFSMLQDFGYRWVYKKRTNEYGDGVAVFYKEALFDAESYSRVEFYQPGVSVLDRDNVGVVIRLRVRQSPRSAIVIATTHLLYNPRRSDVKLAQAQVLLAEIDRLAYNKDAMTYYPVIMTGDFNLQPENGVYRLVTEGKLLYEGMSRRTLHTADDHNTLPRTLLPSRLGVTDRCQHVDVLEARVRGEDAVSTKLYHSETNRDPRQDFSYGAEKDDRFESGTLQHSFNFQSVYEHRKDEEKEVTTHHDGWVTVDYIFYSTPKTKEGEESEQSPLQLLGRLRLPTEEECERYNLRLPNFAFGSDHLPLVGKFLLRLH